MLRTASLDEECWVDDLVEEASRSHHVVVPLFLHQTEQVLNSLVFGRRSRDGSRLVEEGCQVCDLKFQGPIILKVW